MVGPSYVETMMDKHEVDAIVESVEELQRIVEKHILEVGDKHGVNAVISVLMNVGTSMLANMLAIVKYHGVNVDQVTEQAMTELAKKTLSVTAEIHTAETINKFTLNKGSNGKVH
jgi:hypothetical protein